MKEIKLPTLYKRGSKGQVVQWTIRVVEKEDGTAEYITEHGQVNGKLQTAPVKVRQGKNLGKKNETSPFQQAVSEAESKWKKQKDKYYTEDPNPQRPQIAPMLAERYDEYGHLIDFNKSVWVQRKYDGFRCLAVKENGEVRLVSRGNKPIDIPTHIPLQLRSVMQDGEVLDGEIYVHGSFQNVASWANKYHPGKTETLEFHVYDRMTEGTFEERFLRNLPDFANAPHLKLAETLQVNNHDQIKSLHDFWVEEGYEGLVVRHNNCMYKIGGRSRDLLKYKNFIDEEFLVIDAKEGRGKFADMAVFTFLIDETGATFDATPKGTAEIRRDFLTHKDYYIGKKMTVQFQDWSTSNPQKPRFPVAKGIRFEDLEN